MKHDGPDAATIRALVEAGELEPERVVLAAAFGYEPAIRVAGERTRIEEVFEAISPDSTVAVLFRVAVLLTASRIAPHNDYTGAVHAAETAEVLRAGSPAIACSYGGPLGHLIRTAGDSQSSLLELWGELENLVTQDPVIWSADHDRFREVFASLIVPQLLGA